jgi:sirohydrochlorin ferrochelatase
VHTGMVVLGHGSRASVSEANQVVFQVSDMLREKVGHDLVETAIMNRESGLQSLDEAIDKLVNRGAVKITVVPMFFANGVHIQQDIPGEIKELCQHYPGVAISLAGHIGPDPRIADILLERIREVQ